MAMKTVETDAIEVKMSELMTVHGEMTKLSKTMKKASLVMSGLLAITIMLVIAGASVTLVVLDHQTPTTSEPGHSFLILESDGDIAQTSQATIFAPLFVAPMLSDELISSIGVISIRVRAPTNSTSWDDVGASPADDLASDDQRVIFTVAETRKFSRTSITFISETGTRLLVHNGRSTLFMDGQLRPVCFASVHAAALQVPKAGLNKLIEEAIDELEKIGVTDQTRARRGLRRHLDGRIGVRYGNDVSYDNPQYSMSTTFAPVATRCASVMSDHPNVCAGDNIPGGHAGFGVSTADFLDWCKSASSEE